VPIIRLTALWENCFQGQPYTICGRINHATARRILGIPNSRKRCCFRLSPRHYPLSSCPRFRWWPLI